MRVHVISKLFWGCAALLFSSCNLINPDEKQAAYIESDTFALSTNAFQHGSASHDIRDCWLYFNDQAIGTYQMPFNVPVLKEGKGTLTVLPGVVLNGTGFVRIAYPFYRPYTVDIELVKGGITQIEPVTTYFDNVVMPIRVNFDDASGVPLEATSNSDTTLQIITTGNPNVFEGNGSGLIRLSRFSQGFAEVQTINTVSLPKQGKLVYLELNYKSNRELAIGVIGLNAQTQNSKSISTYLEPTANWKKVYVNLTAQVSAAAQATGYKIFFGAAKPEGNQALEVFLDNIKIVYLP